MIDMSVSEYKKILADGDKIQSDVSLFGAFSDKSKLLFQLKLPRRAGAVSVVMMIHADMNDGMERKIKFTHIEDNSFTEDCYTATLDFAEAEMSVGLYYYRYKIDFGDKVAFFGGERSMELLENSGDRQLLIFSGKFDTPKWIRGGIVYHIFVDRFKRSGKCPIKDGAVLNEDWYNGVPQFAEHPGGYVSNNVFFGGDLYGIAEKIDYIASLGVSCIYLSPVFDAASNHKYDTGDYMTVDEMFGGEEALHYLTKAAKEKGISVVLDGVFNHTGDDSVYFNKYGNYDSLGAYQSKESVYYPWFDFKHFPDEYTCWWGIKILPRVNSSNEKYLSFICSDSGVVSKWSKYNVKGWRLDVADELSDSFLENFRNAAKSRDKDSVIWGEVWEDASNKISYGQRRKYFLGNQLDSVMNYPLRDGIISWLLRGDSEKLRDCTEGLYRRYPKQCSDMQMNLISTHDTCRIINELSGVGENGRTNAELSHAKLSPEELARGAQLVRLAYLIAATIPGVPSVYYGDEIGMEGYHDPFCRMPFPWGREDKDLFAYFCKIGKIRRSEKLYYDGLFSIVRCDAEMFVFRRFKNSRCVLTAVNRSDKDILISFTSPVTDLLTCKTMYSCVLKSKTGTVFSGKTGSFESIEMS